MTQRINRDMHYEQCYLHDPCPAPGPHMILNIDDGTCFKCLRPCICNRLVKMRNEATDD